MLNVLLSTFGLVLLGYACRRTNFIDDTVGAGLNQFVMYLALPALLFGMVMKMPSLDQAQARFLLAYGAGSMAVFLLPILCFGKRLSLAQKAIDGLYAAYPNTGLIGVPLAMTVFGQAGAAGTLIAAIFTTSILFAVGIAVIEIDLSRRGGGQAWWRGIPRILLRNPMLFSPVLAGLFVLTGLSMPQALGRMIDMLATATAPCALIALGLFLGKDSVADDLRPRRDLALLGLLKIAAQPLLTFGLASLLRLSPTDKALATFMAAMPTGTGAYILAEHYALSPRMASRVILLTTAGSFLSLAYILDQLVT